MISIAKYFEGDNHNLHTISYQAKGNGVFKESHILGDVQESCFIMVVHKHAKNLGVLKGKALK